jgi:phenylpropionate dioxygenase-like ring-hydroxylating dioxygenase large terminal subunit
MKLSDLKNTRWTLDHPQLGTGPVPVDSYVSPEYFEHIRTLFANTWICTGKRVEEIPNAGDYFIENIEVTKASVIVVRGLDGVIRGFHNTCKHRGTQLLFDSYGSVKGRLTCIYHGWAYSLAGKNLLITEKEMFFDVERMEKDLLPVSVDVWAGFVFINQNPKPRERLKEHLGPQVLELYGDYPFETTTVHLSYKADLECSWPVLRDSQLDGYHLKYLHRRSAPGFMESAEAPNRHAYDFKLLGKHGSGSFYGNRARIGADLSKVAPVAALASKVGQTLASNTAARVDVSKWCKGVNPARAEDWFFDFLYLFPNFHIVFLGYQAYIGHKMMPGSRVDLSSWNAHYYAPPVKADDLEAAWAAEYMKYSLRDLWREDGNTTLGAQRSINSGAFTQMYLQDQEILIRHAEQVLAAEIEKTRNTEKA